MGAISLMDQILEEVKEDFLENNSADCFGYESESHVENIDSFDVYEGE